MHGHPCTELLNANRSDHSAYHGHMQGSMSLFYSDHVDLGYGNTMAATGHNAHAAPALSHVILTDTAHTNTTHRATKHSKFSTNTSYQ